MKMGFYGMVMVMILGMGGCGSKVCEEQQACVRSGPSGEGSVSEEHVWEDIVVTEGNCMDPKVISHVCRECGAKKGNTVDYEGRARALHDYEPYSGSCVEPEYNVVVFYQCDRCSRCGKEKDRQQIGFEPIALKETPQRAGFPDIERM